MKVAFYVLGSGGETERINKACELVENAWLKGERVWLATADNEQAQYVDECLWTFRQDSFVPHERATGAIEYTGATDDTGASDSAAPVLIALHEQLQALPSGVVVNLAPEVVPGNNDASRIVEVLAASDGSRAAGRERYRRYREAGHELDTVHV